MDGSSPVQKIQNLFSLKRQPETLEISLISKEVQREARQSYIISLNTLIAAPWGFVPAPDGKIYLVDITGNRYWGSFYGTCIGVKNTYLNKSKHTNTCMIKWCMY